MSPNSQLHLTNDSFLYACQSEYAARTKKNGSFNSHIRYEPFLLDQYERPKHATVRDFVQTVTAITTHHFQVTPQFRRHEPLNIETVSYFTCAIATLFADLETACKEFFGVGLPAIPSQPPEYSNEKPVSNALIQARNTFVQKNLESNLAPEPFEPFPLNVLTEINSTEQAVIWSCEIWDTVADAIHSAFMEYADTAMGFAYWRYQEPELKSEIDWRVRPPVGEAFAKTFRPLQRSARGERGRGGPERGERFSDDSRSNRKTSDRRHKHAPESEVPQQVLPEGRVQEHRPPKLSERKSEHRRELGNRGDRPAKMSGEREPHARPSSRNDRPAHAGPVISSEHQVEEALQEVKTAVSALKSNPKLGEIALKPANSFIRRQQHSLAVELGLDTESRGEGKDRGVVIRLSAP